MSDIRLTHAQLAQALADLARMLAAEGTQAQLYIVGGAAITLQYQFRDATRDIDAQYYPKDAVHNAALQVARQHGLPDDWLNDRAAMFISPVVDDEHATVFLTVGTVTVWIASPEVLLAMKMRASRPSRDASDIEFLSRKLHVSSVEQAIDIFKAYYPEDPLPARARPLLESIFAQPQDPTKSAKPKL
ncbi:MAG: DUF6036 family nucleotidyltransferase [Ferrimicrobium sp.]